MGSTAHPEPEIPVSTHRWNLWVAGSESAFYSVATEMMGPMTLIPFLFAQAGVDRSWIGLFMITTLLSAFTYPIGSALGGGVQWKLPLCIKIGFLQRVAYVTVPLGVMLFFDSPDVLLMLLVGAWLMANLVGGIGGPLYQFVITNSTWESWWGRMMSLRSILAALGGGAATVFVWWVNRAFPLPTNYAVIAWTGVAMLYFSLYGVARIREVPMQAEHSHGREDLRRTLRTIGAILRDDSRVMWLVTGYILRATGFLIGAYMTAVLIERRSLTHAQMWVPVLLSTAPAIFSHGIAGFMVDRWGVKPAIVLSSMLTVINSFLIMQCQSMTSFVVLFISGNFAGSLLANGWPTMVMRLSTRRLRPAYFTAVSLATAPGTIATTVIGIALVRFTGYDYVFYVSALGGVLSVAIFWWKLPNLRRAPLG